MARDLFEFFQAQREEQNEEAAPGRNPTLLENFFSGKVVKEGDEWDDLIANLGLSLEPEKEKKSDGEKRKPGRPASSKKTGYVPSKNIKPKAPPPEALPPRGVMDQMPTFDQAGEYSPEEFKQVMPQQATDFETDVGTADGMFLVNADGRTYFVPNEGDKIMSYLDGKGWVEADADDLSASNDLAADRYQAVRSQPAVWGDERFKAEDPGGWSDDNASALSAAQDARSGGLDVDYSFGDAPSGKPKSQNVGMDELDLDALIADMEAGGTQAVDPNFKPATPEEPKLMAKAKPTPKSPGFSADTEWNTDDPEFNEFMKGLDFGKK